DGNRAMTTYLGGKEDDMAPLPEIVQIHPPISLTEHSAKATLWLTIDEPILKARAIVVKPDLPFLEYQSEGTYWARTELELRYNEESEGYETVYDYFCRAGKWQVLYQVQSENGVWSDIQIGEVQQTSDSSAAACLSPLTVKMDLNQTRYTGGDTLPLKMTVEGSGEADLYVALTTPGGHFMTLVYPEKWSALNTAQAYLSRIQSADSPIEYPLNLSIPAGLVFGHYSACGILVPPNAEALTQNQWIHSDCAPFEIYDNTQVPTDLSTFRDTLQDGSLGPEMVWIPAGTFRMGGIQGRGYYNERPVHEVSVARFAIGRYEVTHAEFVHFLNTVKRRGPEGEPWFATKAERSSSHLTGSTGNFIVEAGYENHPIIHVSWYGATAYLNWLTEQTGKPYRLPTEAEWEYAARAGTETKYWWGNEIGTNRANCYSSGSEWSGRQTAPVGSFEPNPFGLYDTVGNVWEWCADPWHDNYQNAPTDGRIWEKQGENQRLLRGGSFFDNPYYCRAAYRSRFSSVVHSRGWGFRGCADLAL
ncbi:MAG: formylglycine-generating enzyme family protein, partial [Candidatus Parabeggiatoa sp.]|nr:formylglycine-generating enzyme family protein [Candidatus Parabeggiatoa sp.]